MVKAVIDKLRQFILTKNTYFDKGIELQFNRPEAEIFLNDNEGNYFYLRLPVNISFVQGAQFTMSECSPGLGIGVSLILVAYVENADEDKLLTNLINTLQISGNNISFTSAIYRKEVVIVEELTGNEQEVINSALQSVPDNVALVSVSFTIFPPVILNTCIVNPCKQC